MLMPSHQTSQASLLPPLPALPTRPTSYRLQQPTFTPHHRASSTQSQSGKPALEEVSGQSVSEQASRALEPILSSSTIRSNPEQRQKARPTETRSGIGSMTISTRDLSQMPPIILIQTRWHEDDLAGRLLREASEEGGEHWDVISLPALSELWRGERKPVSGGLRVRASSLDPLRQKGPLGRAWRALCPDRFTREDLERIKQKTRQLFLLGPLSAAARSSRGRIVQTLLVHQDRQPAAR